MLTNKITYNIQDTKFLENAADERALKWAEERFNKAKKAISSYPKYKEIAKNIADVLYDKNKLINGKIRDNYVYNFWTDQTNPAGVWRRTTLEEYGKELPNWETLIDFDELSLKFGKKIVFRGSNVCPQNKNKFIINMSFGGKDEFIFREWDLSTKQFIDDGFSSQDQNSKWLEVKNNTLMWIDENKVLVTTAFNQDDLTKPGYPCNLYLWHRGEKLENARNILTIDKNLLLIYSNRLLNKNVNPELFLVAVKRTMTDTDYYLFDKDFVPQKIILPIDAEIEGSFNEYLFVKLRSEWSIDESFKPGTLLAVHYSDLLKEDSQKTNLQLIFTPTDKKIFQSVSVTENVVFLKISNNLNDEIYSLKFDNNNFSNLNKIQLPDEIATISLITDDEEEQALMIFENIVTPPSMYLWNDNKFTLIRKPVHEFDSENYISKQLHATSKDGTLIPYLITHHKDIKYDGNNPTILYGYGGFEVSLTPRYLNLLNKIWINNGYIYVTANIRGGGEFGPSWHQAAVQKNRQKSFDDFIAVAEDLIKREITSNKHLGIQGGSNGGLLVTTCMTQRPDLFKAVVSEIPVIDMLRYTEFGAGHNWISEYGDPKDSESRKYLSLYSPIENLNYNVNYPDLLLTSSVQDQRTHPWHARIIQYLLEKHSLADSLYIENQDAGHGSGSNLSDKIDYLNDIFCFFHIKLT
jgi:prolyl oligopeptidase